MVQHYTDEELRELIESLRALPKETEWAEFKRDNSDPLRIGMYISGISNTATLLNRSSGYVVWGIDDVTHDIVGTTFNPSSAKQQGMEFEFWLEQKLGGEASFRFARIEIEGHALVVLTIDAARHRPIAFDGVQYVRINSSVTALKRFPDAEGRLWDILRNESFETGIAHDGATADQVFRLLDLAIYFQRSRTQAPASPAEQLEYAEGLKVLVKRDDGKWQITNLGALVFANKLSDFPTVERKAIRVVQYSGVDRLNAVRRADGNKGYATGFTGLLTWVKALLPAREDYINGERVASSVYSDLLLREVIANALIHQDFLRKGTGPQIELFSDRIEVTNPGAPLTAPDRLINAPAVSRNQLFGRLMRNMNLCEESGTGWDKIANETELAGLPSPSIEVEELGTRVTIYGPRKLTTMEKRDKVRAVYFHACLQWARGQHLTNSSLRVRFGINVKSTSQVSRLLSDAIELEQIALFDESVGHRAKSYVPYWALHNDNIV